MSLTKTEIFRSDTAEFSYDFKDEIEENDQRYKLDRVDYTVLSKQEETEIKHEVTTKTVDNLYEPSVVSPEQTKSIVIDGKEYTAALEDISYERMIITDRTAEVETTVKLSNTNMRTFRARKKSSSLFQKMRLPKRTKPKKTPG